MALYFFDAPDIADLTGSECTDLADVRARALRWSCELLSDLPERLWNGQPWTMTVSDASRVPLFTLRFHVEPTGAVAEVARSA